jgi:hypothetical protein
VNEPVAIVFFPESPGASAAILNWQARNPGWRVLLDQVIECPVCGIRILAIADTALLDPEGVRTAVRDYRDEHLRSACSDHYLPTDEYWAVVESRTR